MFLGKLPQILIIKSLAEPSPGFNFSVNLLLFTLPPDSTFVCSFIFHQAYHTAMASGFGQVICQLAEISQMIQQLSYIPYGAIKSYLFFIIQFLEAGILSHQFNYFTAKLLHSSATPLESGNIHSVNGPLPRHVMPLQLFTSLSNYLPALKIAYISPETSQTLKGISSKHDASCTFLHSYSAS